MKPIILASGSPRRRELLETAGVPFTVCVSDIEEVVEAGLTPAQTVKSLAKQKALAVAKEHPKDIVLGADTVVALDGEILGKPADAEDAVAMLTRLSGKCHSVYTGVALVRKGKAFAFATQTKVWFYELTPEEIADYVATGEPLDKAGAYGIQGKGCTLVERIEGDYANVVGLPVAAVYRALKSLEAADKAKDTKNK